MKKWNIAIGDDWDKVDKTWTLILWYDCDLGTKTWYKNDLTTESETIPERKKQTNCNISAINQNKRKAYEQRLLWYTATW